YDPVVDAWTSTSITNAPTGRIGHSAVWTGSEMIVWGGEDVGETATGGRYNPITDTWSPMAYPFGLARKNHSDLWTGTEMLIWGGDIFGGCTSTLRTGARYNPSTDSWTAVSTVNAPSARSLHSAVWTGQRMIIWGGYPGGCKEPGPITG